MIAIIAILAAILFPVFAKTREKARHITCASNLKQLSLGFAQYEQDNDEHMPWGERNESGQPGDNNGVPCIYGFHGIFWPQEIGPYTAQTPKVLAGSPYYTGNAVFLCPGHDRTTFASAPFCNGTPMSTYAGNSNQSILAIQDLGQTPITRAQIQRPADIVLLSEYTRHVGVGDQFYDLFFASVPAASALIMHNDLGNNSLFIDGHVKFMTATYEASNPNDMFAINSL